MHHRLDCLSMQHPPRDERPDLPPTVTRAAETPALDRLGPDLAAALGRASHLSAALEGGLSMKTSTERILTTHTGSLPRPADLADRHDREAVRAAVEETVRRQLEAGVDVVNDG